MMDKRNRNLIMAILLALVAVSGALTVAVLTHEPVIDVDIYSPTAILPLDETQRAVRLTQTAEHRRVTSGATTTTGRAPAAAVSTTQAPICGWQWATQPNPDLSDGIREGVLAELPELPSMEVRAESFGENCINADGTVRSFATMQTDFRVVVWVPDLPAGQLETVEPTLAATTHKILSVLAGYPPDDTPGPMAGIINIEYPTLIPHLKTTYWLRVNYTTAMEAFNQGLTGSALLDALGGLHQQDEIMPT